MAALVICAVRDRAVDSFLQPIFVVASGAAVRSFMDEINNAESPWYKHPDDFDLYQVGVFESDTGSLEPMAPALLVRGKDVRRGREEVQ